MTRTHFGLRLAAGLLFALPVFADAFLIDFTTASAGAGGTITSLGGGNVKGENIPIALLLVIDAPLHTGESFAVTGGCSGQGGSGFGCLNFNTLTDVITIEGDIVDLGITGGSPYPVLMAGSFTDKFVFSATNNNGDGSDDKLNALERALGIGAGERWHWDGFIKSKAGSGPTANTLVPFSVDISNTTVPEPGSIALLATFLLSSGVFIRKVAGRV